MRAVAWSVKEPLSAVDGAAGMAASYVRWLGGVEQRRGFLREEVVKGEWEEAGKKGKRSGSRTQSLGVGGKPNGSPDLLLLLVLGRTLSLVSGKSAGMKNTSPM